MKKMTTQARKKTISDLAQFLMEKTIGSQIASECIQSYMHLDLDPDNMSLMRTELKEIRDGADFALRQLKNL